MGNRHVPIRTCLTCGRKLPQGDLVRIVRTPDGTVEMDFGGRRAGRGAYLCADEQCWETALKKDDIDRAIRVTLSREDKLDLKGKWTDWHQRATGVDAT